MARSITDYATLKLVTSQHLPKNEFNSADFPAFLEPKTKQRKTFLSVRCFLRSVDFLLVTWNTEAGLPLYPTYIKLAKARRGSSSVIRAHCNHTFTKQLTNSSNWLKCIMQRVTNQNLWKSIYKDNNSSALY